MVNANATGEQPGRREVVSLKGEDGEKAHQNIRGLLAGTVSIEDVGSGYYVSPEGILGIYVDEKTFAALPGKSQGE